MSKYDHKSWEATKDRIVTNLIPLLISVLIFDILLIWMAS